MIIEACGSADLGEQNEHFIERDHAVLRQHSRGALPNESLCLEPPSAELNDVNFIWLGTGQGAGDSERVQAVQEVSPGFYARRAALAEPFWTGVINPAAS
eukprot:CAMPEP_0185856018 /NCGR_PEP_ID=MMETSP1354-20130828/27530_1 /TAXON_ID=708628 /ORGANISM="Erythrolobus madagascarensis, Strain CCMP3276" /LENGTH=99 /DNA_ID=CAMNT_0028558157 /DNA_START=53 /DNA_END=352 /DNA_ORIENTATION=-